MIVEVYPESQLTWASAVPCAERRTHDDPLCPKPGVLPDGPNIDTLCFLNEPRVRNGRYHVFHYDMKQYIDDGPPALDQIVEASRLIEERLQAFHQLTIFCPDGEEFAFHRNFSALCVAAHRVLVRKESASEAAAPWRASGRKSGSSPKSGSGPPAGHDCLGFYPFSWAARGLPGPPRILTFEHCLEALEFGRDHGWIDFQTFDCDLWRQRWLAYDFTGLVPQAIDLLADPMSTVKDPDPATVTRLIPDNGGPIQEGDTNFASFFKAGNVQLIVRLNLMNEPHLRSYDASIFEKYGFDHLDLGFDDVGNGLPTKAIIRKILTASAMVPEGKKIAFHCKGGFGRSAICASMLMIHRYDMPGRLSVAWTRMTRPGTFTTLAQARLLQRLQGRADTVKHFMGGEQACCSVA